MTLPSLGAWSMRDPDSITVCICAWPRVRLSLSQAVSSASVCDVYPEDRRKNLPEGNYLEAWDFLVASQALLFN